MPSTFNRGDDELRHHQHSRHDRIELAATSSASSDGLTRRLALLQAVGWRPMYRPSLARPARRDQHALSGDDKITREPAVRRSSQRSPGSAMLP
jgi:hypothetical protein